MIASARIAFGRRLLSLPALISIALGIGAAATLFGLIQGVLLRPLPYPDAERLFLLRSRNVRTGELRPFVSALDFRDYRRHTRSFDGMALFRWVQLDLPGEAGLERVQGLRVTPEFFRVLGLSPYFGALPDTDSVAAERRSIVLSRNLWRRRFGEDAGLVGETIEVDSWDSLPSTSSLPHRVLAVVEEPSRYLPMTSGLDRRPVGVDHNVEFWLPMVLGENELTHREHRGVYGAVARLAPGVTLAEAEAEIQALAVRLEASHPETNADWSVSLLSVSEAVTGPVRPVVGLLSAGVMLLLALSCSNVATMQLVRAIEREGELVVRRALGASSARLAGHVIAETLVLVVAGGALGLALSVFGARWVVHLAPPELPRVEEIEVDAGVLLFALGLTLLTGLLAAWIPAWRASLSRPSLPGRGDSVSTWQRSFLQALAVVAIALSLLLAIGAGLLRRSLDRLLAVDPGFEREGVLTMNVSLPEARYSWQRNTEFVREILDRLGELPEVTDVGAVRGIPGRETRIEMPLAFDDTVDGRWTASAHTRIRVVTPSYFRTMRIPFLAGRGFERGDESGETGYTRVVVVNETFAQRFWPEGTAVGQRFGLAGIDLPPMEIIGVVADVRYEGLERGPGPELYYPEALFPQPRIDLAIRTRGDPAGVRSRALAEIREVEPDVIVTDVETLEGVLERSVADRRFAAWLVSVFSTIALILAIVGIVGVVARRVAVERRSIGVRLALGARRSAITRMVLGQSLALTATGVAVGVALAALSTRLLSAFLFEVEATDLATFVAASLVVTLAAMLASYVPARRAARTNPVDVLRSE